MWLTCIRCGSGSRLWKSGQRGGGSSSGGLRASGVDSAALELHAGVLGGRCCCCVRHGGERQRVCAAAGSAGGRSSHTCLSQPLFSFDQAQSAAAFNS